MIAATQHADDVADLVEHRARRRLDPRQRRERARRLRADLLLRSGGLQRDLADPLRDGVVHGEREPGALLGHGRRGLGLLCGPERLGTRRELRGQVGTEAQQRPTTVGVPSMIAKKTRSSSAE